METTRRVCDRCGTELDRPHGIITMNYHHPRKLDLCEECEGAFTLWLGKHPLWNTPLSHILEGRCKGTGYPTEQQIIEYKGG